MGVAAAIPIAIGGISSLLGAAGDASAASEKAKQDRLNAALAQQRAADSMQRGAAEAGQIRMKGSQVIGAERAGYAASGIDENVGTAADIQAQTRAISELDAKTTMNNAAREAWGFQTQASQFKDQANLDEAAGKQAVVGGLLGGLGGVAGGILNGKTKGYF